MEEGKGLRTVRDRPSSFLGKVVDLESCLYSLSVFQDWSIRRGELLLTWKAPASGPLLSIGVWPP